MAPMPESDIIPQDDLPFSDLEVHDAFTAYRGQYRVFMATDRHTRCDRHGQIWIADGDDA